ncbi:MAG TPA: ABC transporter permease [Candidatus Sulfotelmatobacter sp.]|nr:ABC transporter permease [Candidatus Sulfotelmatobacter sp.]
MKRHANRLLRDLDQEIREHIEFATQENIERGMAPEEARYAALRKFGNVTRVKEDARKVWSTVWLEQLGQDIRFALRQLCRSPIFTAVAILTLALGIGATTAIFSVVNSALLRPLAYRDPEQLYLVREIVPQMAKFYPTLEANLPDFRIWQKRVRSFEDVAIAESTTADLSGQGQPEVLHGVRASANILSVLGATPALGRSFRPEEDESGRGHVVILTDAFWRNRFHADPSEVGKTIALDGIPHEIVGVLAPSFRFPAALGGVESYARIAFFKPLNGPAEYEQGLIGEFDFAAVARLRSGVTPEQALAELNVVQAEIARQANEGVDLKGLLVPLEEEVVGRARRGLLLLLGAVIAVLLIVCCNLASLLLARVPGRMREAAIRASLGATQGRLIRQLLTETLLLSCAGGVLGVLTSIFALQWLVRMAPPGIPRLDEVHMDTRVLLFALVVSLVTGAMFGVIPALRVVRSQPVEALKSGAAATTESRRTRRVRQSLVSFEVGLTTLLLILAGLLMVSLSQLLHVHSGFVAENVLIAGVDLPPQSYSRPQDRLHFYDRVLAGMQAMPAIRAAGWVSIPPLAGEGSVTGITVPGGPQQQEEIPIANYRPVSADYFSAMGIPLLEGRTFGPADEGREIVVVSQSVAERFWAGKSAIGQICITQWGKDTPAEVVGVVGDIRTVQLDAPPLMMVYVPHWFNSMSVPTSGAMVLRTGNDPSSYVGPVRQLIHSIDADVPVTTLRPMGEIVAHSVDGRRFPMFLAMVFALSSLLLASLGIYGVVRYSVEQRRQELGIRIALGANLRDLFGMVLRQGMAPVLIGLAGGMAAALLMGRVMGSLLFGIGASDPLTLATVAMVVASVALLACYLPARRATRVDPMVALRYE